MHEVREQARPIFKRYYPEHTQYLPHVLLPIIFIEHTPTPDEQLPVGVSKIGGLPDLRPGSWPLDEKGELMFFVAQFNLADVKPHDEDDLLPPAGLLSFFTSENSDQVIEVRLEPDLQGLERSPEPYAGYLEADWAVASSKVTFEADVFPWGELGYWRDLDSRIADPREPLEDDPEWKALVDPIASGQFEAGRHHAFMLGNPEAATAYNRGMDPTEIGLLYLAALSEALPDSMWVDALMFMIDRTDLQCRDFSRTRFDIDHD